MPCKRALRWHSDERVAKRLAAVQVHKQCLWLPQRQQQQQRQRQLTDLFPLYEPPQVIQRVCQRDTVTALTRCKLAQQEEPAFDGLVAGQLDLRKQ